MPKVSAEHRAARHAEIVDAALRVLMRKGYSRATMADIIAESGLSAGAIYGYFSGKQDLVRAVGEHTLGKRVAEIEALASDHVPSPSEVMQTVLTGIRNETFAPVIVQLWGEAATDPLLKENLQGVFGRLRETIATAVIRWGRAHPDRVRGDINEWAANVAPVLASLGPGFMLFSTMLDEFDADAYLRSISLTLRLED